MADVIYMIAEKILIVVIAIDVTIWCWECVTKNGKGRKS